MKKNQGPVWQRGLGESSCHGFILNYELDPEKNKGGGSFPNGPKI
jgi:hypothetical protein